jgi:O-antigen ligase
MGMKLSEICFLLAFFLVLLSSYRIRPIKLPTFFAQSFTLFVTVAVLSWLIATISTRTTRVEPCGFIYEIPFTNILTVGRFVFSLAIVWLIVQCVRDRYVAELFAKTHVAGGTLAAVIGLGLYILSILGYSIDLPLFRQFGGKSGVWGVRLAGTAYEPGALGNYFVSVVPLTVAFYLSSRDKKRAGFLLGILIVQGLALALTFSSGGLGCTIIAVILLLMLGRRMILAKRALSLAFLAMLLIGGVVFIARIASISYLQIYTVLSKIGTESVSARWATNKCLLQMFADRPWFGIGIGNFAHVFGLYAQYSPVLSHYSYPADWRANNDYLTLLAETGVIGFACFALVLVSVFKEIVRVVKQSTEIEEGLVYVGIACVIIGLLCQCWVAFTILNPYTWFLIGLIMSTKFWLSTEATRESTL